MAAFTGATVNLIIEVKEEPGLEVTVVLSPGTRRCCVSGILAHLFCPPTFYFCKPINAPLPQGL